MATTFTRAEVFSANLLVAMQRKNVSRRELARRLYPEDPELGRSNVRRSLRGAHEPTRRTVESYADALEIEPDELLPEEDDQEVAQDVTRLVADLEAQLRRLKRATRVRVAA